MINFGMPVMANGRTQPIERYSTSLARPPMGRIPAPQHHSHPN